MSNILFHTGALYISGDGKTPRRIMTMQETSFDFKGDLKKLMGEKQFAADSVVGTVDITAKAKTGQLDPDAFNDLFFGKTVTKGATVLVENEIGTVLLAKYTAAAGVAFSENLGIRDVDSGTVLKLVTGAPAAGEYSVNAATGEYTFNAGMTGKKVQVDYLKTDAAGSSLIVTNQLAGSTINFRGIFAKTFRDGRKLTMICRHCVCDSVQFGFKQNDYTMPDFSFSLNAGDDDVPFEWHWSNTPA